MVNSPSYKSSDSEQIQSLTPLIASTVKSNYVSIDLTARITNPASFQCSLPLNKVQTVLTRIQKSKTESTSKSAHLPKRKILCLYCDRTFVNEVLKQKHIERCHATDRKRRTSLRKNLSNVTNTFCNCADTDENDLTAFFKHLIDIHSDKYFACFDCKLRFDNFEQLGRHDDCSHRTKKTCDDAKKPSILSNVRATRRIKQNAANYTVKRSKRLQGKTVKTEKQQRTPRKLTEKKPILLKNGSYYPLFQVQKITDHSIDNLKIQSLTFEDVFDKAFFTRIKCNIQENLLNHIDGKLFENEESETRISNFEQRNHLTSSNLERAENFGCELTLNAVTPAHDLSQIGGEGPEALIEYASKAKRKLIKKDEKLKDDQYAYKYFTRRKYQASILETKENTDLSKLDMWTQYVVKERQQKAKSHEETLLYVAGQEYKNQVQRNELNRILDRRGPFEDLREEVSKQGWTMTDGDVIADVMTDLVDRVCAKAAKANSQGDRELPPSYLSLGYSEKQQRSDIVDKSDRISLICSSQETENFEVSTNKHGFRTEKVELTGEWARSRIYVCAACGLKLPNIKLFLEHKTTHQNVWVQHYEFVGNQSELCSHLSIPVLGKVGDLMAAKHVTGKLWRRSDDRRCTKCEKACNSLGELHRHILECGGDWTWMMERKKYKYRAYGTRSRRKRRGLIKRIYSQKVGSTTSEKKIYKKPLDIPRQKPSDAESIQRMLANLPAKRRTRKLISMKDTRSHNRLHNKLAPKQPNSAKTTQNKEFGSVDRNQKKTKNQQNFHHRRSLRSLNKVLTTRSLETNTSLLVKRKLNKRNSRTVVTSKSGKSNENQDPQQKTVATNEERKEETVQPQRRCSPRNVTIKSFFPVQKKRSAVATVGKTLKKRKVQSSPLETSRKEVPNDTGKSEETIKKVVLEPEAAACKKHSESVKTRSKRAKKPTRVTQVTEIEQGKSISDTIEKEETFTEPVEKEMPSQDQDVCISKSKSKKLKKPARGLNDCIAMLTSKLNNYLHHKDVETAEEIILKVPLFNEHFTLKASKNDEVDTESVKCASEIRQECLRENESNDDQEIAYIDPSSNQNEFAEENQMTSIIVSSESKTLENGLDFGNYDLISEATAVEETNTSEPRRPEPDKPTCQAVSVKPTEDQDAPNLDQNTEKIDDAKIDEYDVRILEDDAMSLSESCSSKLRDAENNKGNCLDKVLELKTSDQPPTGFAESYKKLDSWLNNSIGEEISNCVDRKFTTNSHENGKTNESHQGKRTKRTKAPKKSKKTADSSTTSDKTSLADEVILRRSSRSKKVTSYNELDFVDVVLEDLDRIEKIKRLSIEECKKIDFFHSELHDSKTVKIDKSSSSTNKRIELDLNKSSNPTRNEEIGNNDSIETRIGDNPNTRTSNSGFKPNSLDSSQTRNSEETTSENPPQETSNCKSYDIFDFVDTQNDKSEESCSKHDMNSGKNVKINTDELFDLLKAQPCENIVFARPTTDSFLNNFHADDDDNDFDASIFDKSVFMDSNDAVLTSSNNDDVKVDTNDDSDSRREKNKSKNCSLIRVHCEICDKSFTRAESLTKHRRTITHIAKLSEIEAKINVGNQSNDEKAEENRTSLEDVLEVPKENGYFADLRHQQPPKYRSLGERKSFESDINESAGKILEKQIHLLENIISPHSTFLEELSTTKPDNDEFLKPGIFEEDYEDKKSTRKVLNRDEELFLECCSLLKSGSELSNNSKNTRKDATISVDEVTEKNNLYMMNRLDFNSDGDSDVKSPVNRDLGRIDTRSYSTDFLDVSLTGPDDGNCSADTETVTDAAVRQLNFKDVFASPTQRIHTPAVSPGDEKTLMTKGALKIFEGIKVSISTSDIMIPLSSKPAKKSTELEVDDTKIRPISKTTTRRKSASIVRTTSHQVHHDIYDFEETQDNSDVFVRPNFGSFRGPKPDDEFASQDNDYLTKKKCMIMGRIFKNAASKSKLNDEIRDIPMEEQTERVEKFVLNCNQPLDTLEQELPPSAGSKKNRKTKKNAASSDDEFNLISTKKRRVSKKNCDNSINIEQEIRECIGVASRKSQRKCTSGKQNVLIEYWTSDESLQETTETPTSSAISRRKKTPKCDTKELSSCHPNRTVKNYVEDSSATKNCSQDGSQLTTKNCNRRKRSDPLYHWSSSSDEDDAADLIEIKPIRDDYEGERPIQHGWIVGESPKKLVTMLAQAKGKKNDCSDVAAWKKQS